MNATLTRPAPRLTGADVHMLRVVFADAHRNGRMTDADHDRTVITLDRAAQRQHDLDRQLLESVMG